ncbi:MAG: hypothetical protein ACRERE_21270 [Candidatus Entotheonellia bacterium]
MGEWTASAAFFQQLTAQEAMDGDEPAPEQLARDSDVGDTDLGGRDYFFQ